MEMEPCLPFEDISLEGLSQPLKGRTRIQYTCFAVSNQFIMIGTNTGGVYVFNRKSRQFVSILPGQAGGVTCVSVDGAEQLVAAGSVQGAVSVYACPTARSWSGQLTALARLDSEVRALCWRHAHWTGRLVYVGTAAGKVLAILVNKKKTPAASATIAPMLQLDSAVCEMMLCSQTLLVSTLGFCYLCNIQMEVFAQVGTQPRSGRLGACFLGETVFCARPGLRVWEVHLSGQITSTHQLRPALDDAAPRRVVSACDQAACLQDGGSGGGKSALGLVKLVPMSGGAVAAFSGDAVFVLQLAARRVVLWTSLHGKVRDLAAVGDELYVQCEGGAMRRLLVRQPSQIVRELRAGRGVGECARFLLSHGELTDLCRSRLPLQVLTDAVQQFGDDAPMQTELTRLAAVLRDRLAEDGLDVGEKGRTTVGDRRHSTAPIDKRGKSEHTTKTDDFRAEREEPQSEDPAENGDQREGMIVKAERAAEMQGTRESSVELPEPAEEVIQEGGVPGGESSVESAVADSSCSEELRTAHSSETRSVPSSEESAASQPPPLLPPSAQPDAPEPPANEAIVFRSSRRRRPRARGRPTDPRVARPPESQPPEPPSPTEPASMSPSRTWALPPPPPPPPAPVEWHDSPGVAARWRAPPATPQMGVYGYTPGLALQPEVLDAFSDLVEDVRGVMSSGAQRLVQRLLWQPSGVPAAPVTTATNTDGTGRPDEVQRRESTETERAESAAGGSSGERAESSLSELAAAADAVPPSVPAVLRWLDAVAAVHCRHQSTEAARENGASYPALVQLCGEPDGFVCERSFPVAISLRKEISRLLSGVLLFLACDGEVHEELAGWSVVSPPTEETATVCRGGLGVATEENGDPSPTAGETVGEAQTASAVESDEKSIIDQDVATSSGNESTRASNAINELTRAEISTDPDSGVHVSSKTGDSSYMTDANEEKTDHSKGLGDKLGAIRLAEETGASYAEELHQSHAVASEASAATVEDTAGRRAAALGGCVADTEPEEVRGPSGSPAPGSPAWLAERLAGRLWYLLPATELRTRLTRLPAGPRGRLWRLLLRGTEARLGPLSVRPGDAAAALELAAGTNLDWLPLARLAAGLCRVDPAAAAALCLQHGDILTPLDALYVCRHAAAPGQITAAFTAYLTAAGAEAAGPLLADAELAAAAEAALTALWRCQAARLRCRCGQPRPGAHRAPRPAATLLRRLLAVRLAGDRLSRQLWTLGDFSGWLETGAAVQLGDTESSADRESLLAAVLCQLDDSALLPAAGPLLSSWRPLLVGLSAVRPGRCCRCGAPLSPADQRPQPASARRPVSLQTLLAFVTSREGPEAALQLLQTASDVIPQQLTTSCYRNVILSTVLNRRAAGLGAAFGAEMLGLNPAPLADETVEVLYSEVGRWAPPPLPAAGRSAACAASLASDCPSCCLPLRNRHLLQPHGLVVFPCRHAFHAVCVLRRGAGCLLCRR